MNVDGAANVNPSITGVCDDGIYYCGNPIDFTLVNAGTLQSSVVALSLTNTTNFYIKAQTCTVAGGNADGRLDPNESCTITLIPKSSGNTTYTGNLQVSGDNNPFAILQGTSTNFGCVAGRVAPGGVYAACGLSSPEGAYDLVVTPGGCTSTTVNPTCAGGSDTILKTYGMEGVDFYTNNWISQSTQGAQTSVDAMAYLAQVGGSLPAIEWCNSLIYSGYDDWYLPSANEFLSNIYPSKSLIGGFVNTRYITNTLAYPNGTHDHNFIVTMDMAQDIPRTHTTIFVLIIRGEDIMDVPGTGKQELPDHRGLVSTRELAMIITMRAFTVLRILMQHPIQCQIGSRFRTKFK